MGLLRKKSIKNQYKIIKNQKDKFLIDFERIFERFLARRTIPNTKRKWKKHLNKK